MLTESPSAPEIAPHTEPAAANPQTTGLREILWTAVILMGGLFIMSRSNADPDLWGHVTYGQEVLRDGHLHESTTWSYAVDDFRWVNHENIAELMMASAADLGGQTGLLLVKSTLTLLLLGIPLLIIRRLGGGLWVYAAVTLLISVNLSFHWLVRPHMLSYVSGMALMALLAAGLPGAITERPAELRFGRILWLIPPLMCFWTNSHGGYLAGLAILTAWLGLDATELLLRRDARFLPTVRHHAILFSVTAAACMINPYGLELHTWMLSSLGRPRPEISEWAPLPLWTADGLPFWGIVLGTFLCLKRSGEPIRWPGFIVMLLLTWQALKHHRHLPFVAMIACMILAPHLVSVLRQATAAFRRKSLAGNTSDRLISGRRAVALPACLLLLLSAIQYPRQSQLNVDRGYYPVSAMQFMADNRLEGRVFVTFNWAQYAIAVFSRTSPDSQIAFDGRFRTCYPQHLIDMYFDFILGDLPAEIRYREDASGPFDPGRALEFRQPNLVLFERERRNCIRTMENEAADWCLLYQDSLAQLWGRRQIYDDPTSPRFLPKSHRHISDDLQEDSVAWPAIPVGPASRVQLAADDTGRFVN